MKISHKPFRTFLLVSLGMSLAMMSAALSFPSSALTGTTRTPIPATLVIVPTPTPASVAGTSDGILIMAVVIVLIIILPIWWHRRAWARP